LGAVAGHTKLLASEQLAIATGTLQKTPKKERYNRHAVHAAAGLLALVFCPYKKVNHSNASFKSVHVVALLHFLSMLRKMKGITWCLQAKCFPPLLLWEGGAPSRA
jgi:hypothetical protein